jgi:hypothetical protein
MPFILNKTLGNKASVPVVHFKKNYICHHIIFLAARYGCCSIPLKYQTVKIKAKKKRGRKKKAKSALEFQVESSVEETSSTDSSDDESYSSSGDEQSENMTKKRKI